MVTKELLSPIILFVYKRLNTLVQTVESLKKSNGADQSILYIYSDDAKDNGDQHQVNEVRKYIETVTGFREVRIIKSPFNKGLANSIIDGVTEVISRHGSAIILEDDLLLSTNFLDFMNQALNEYKNTSNIYSVSGFSFNFKVPPGYGYDGYFLSRGWSWGWATWKDRWENIDWQVSDYSQFLKTTNLRRKFSEGGSDLNSMLKKQMRGKLDSWAIRWFYDQFKKNGLTYYPTVSKVANVGFDENATHTKKLQKRFLTPLDDSNHRQFRHPVTIERTMFFQTQLQNRMGLMSRSISKIQTSLAFILKK